MLGIVFLFSGLCVTWIVLGLSLIASFPAVAAMCLMPAGLMYWLAKRAHKQYWEEEERGRR